MGRPQSPSERRPALGGHGKENSTSLQRAREAEKPPRPPATPAPEAPHLNLLASLRFKLMIRSKSLAEPQVSAQIRPLPQEPSCGFESSAWRCCRPPSVSSARSSAGAEDGGRHAALLKKIVGQRLPYPDCLCWGKGPFWHTSSVASAPTARLEQSLRPELHRPVAWAAAHPTQTQHPPKKNSEHHPLIPSPRSPSIPGRASKTRAAKLVVLNRGGELLQQIHRSARRLRTGTPRGALPTPHTPPPSRCSRAPRVHSSFLASTLLHTESPAPWPVEWTK